MPIASGAAGRVDVGVDLSTTWRPDGLKRKPVNRQCDSYLQRYQELKLRNDRKKLLKSMQENTDPISHEIDGSKEETPETNEDTEDHTSDEPPSAGRSKKSALCVIL